MECARWRVDPTATSHLKPKTLAGYESLLRTRVLPTFGSLRLDRIEPLAVEKWIGQMQSEGLSPSRIRQAHQVLSASLKAAVRNKYLPSNPAEGVLLPRLIPREMGFLQPDQVEDLADRPVLPGSIGLFSKSRFVHFGASVPRSGHTRSDSDLSRKVYKLSHRIDRATTPDLY